MNKLFEVLGKYFPAAATSGIDAIIKSFETQIVALNNAVIHLYSHIQSNEILVRDLMARNEGYRESINKAENLRANLAKLLQ